MGDSTAISFFKPTHKSLDDLPWLPFTPYSDDVQLKIVHLDFVKGETVMMLRAPAGARLGRHNHYGRVIAYTVQGAWRYEEHSWVSRAGDFVYEVANSAHSFASEPGEDVIVFLLVEGVLEFLDDNGKSVGMETSHTFGARYEDHCAKTGSQPVDLTKFALA